MKIMTLATFAAMTFVATLCTSIQTSAQGPIFAPAVSYFSGGDQPSSVAVADVNGDGNPDLLVANLCANYGACGADTDGKVAVLLGNGDGTFQAGGTYQTAVTYSSGGVGALSVVVADVNGDGKPDLMVANETANDNNNGSVGVLLGNGDGTFQTAVTYSSGGYEAQFVAVADVNGDGKPDLMLANWCENSKCATDGTVGVLLGNGDGTFQTAVPYGSDGYFANSVAVMDVNGDGKLDLLVSNWCGNDINCVSDGTVGVLLGNGDGTFQTAVPYGSGGWDTASVAAADVNGDGKPDLLMPSRCVSYTGNNCWTVGDGTVGVLLGNGDGTFQTAVPYGSDGWIALFVAVTDVNGDGKPDLLVANAFGNDNVNDGSVGVLLGNGDGTFQTVVPYDSGGNYANSVAVTDVNGDGKPDLLVTNMCGRYYDKCAGGGTVDVLINKSLGSTTTALTSSPNPSNFGQVGIFTATVTPSQFFKFQLTGTVTFNYGTTTLCNAVTLNGGTATCAYSALPVGSDTVTAAYSGDANFTPSGGTVGQTVDQASTTLALTSSVNPSGLGQAVTFTATLTPQYGGQASGTVTFKDGSKAFGSAAVSGNAASLTTSGLAIGTHPISAVYSGDSNFTGSMSPVLSQVVKGPAVGLSPASLTFPDQVVFTTSKIKMVTLTNTGLEALNIKSIKVTGSFAQTNNCGTMVNPSASCTISVAFRPKTIGTLTGSVSITDNAPASPQKIPLTGTGTYVQLSPTSLNFGNQPVGTKSLAKRITLSNKGSVAVSISSISVTGANAGDFAQTNTCGTSVAAGASCSIRVTFTPSAKGKRMASVSVRDNGGGSPQTASVSGTGT